jgi:hypothetical protein
VTITYLRGKFSDPAYGHLLDWLVLSLQKAEWWAECGEQDVLHALCEVEEEIDALKTLPRTAPDISGMRPSMPFAFNPADAREGIDRLLAELGANTETMRQAQACMDEDAAKIKELEDELDTQLRSNNKINKALGFDGDKRYPCSEILAAIDKLRHCARPETVMQDLIDKPSVVEQMAEAAQPARNPDAPLTMDEEIDILRIASQGKRPDKIAGHLRLPLYLVQQFYTKDRTGAVLERISGASNAKLGQLLSMYRHGKL